MGLIWHNSPEEGKVRLDLSPARWLGKTSGQDSAQTIDFGLISRKYTVEPLDDLIHKLLADGISYLAAILLGGFDGIGG